jgi:hypothetical protein
MDTLELLRGGLDCLQAGCTALARGLLAEWRRLGTTRHEPLTRLLSIGIDLQEREGRDEALPATLLDSLLVRCRQDLAALAPASVRGGEGALQAQLRRGQEQRPREMRAAGPSPLLALMGRLVRGGRSLAERLQTLVSSPGTLLAS